MTKTPQYGPDLSNPCDLRVLDEWTDYNGHFNVAYYVRAFDIAFAAFLSGLGADSAATEGRTVRSRVEYLREVHLGRPLHFTSQILVQESSRLKILQAMYVDEEGYCAAIEERVTELGPIDATATSRLDELARRHAGFPVPEGWGGLAI